VNGLSAKDGLKAMPKIMPKSSDQMDITVCSDAFIIIMGLLHTCSVGDKGAFAGEHDTPSFLVCLVCFKIKNCVRPINKLRSLKTEQLLLNQLKRT